MANLFEERRSVGDIDPAWPVPDGTLREIVRLASFAPSASNLQPWRLIAVRSDEAKRRLHEAARRQPRILAAPVTLIVVGDGEGYRASNPSWAELIERGADPERVARSVARAAETYGATPETRTRFAHKNAALFAMSLMLAAKHLGVDSHPMDGFDIDGVSQAFGLRPGEQPVALISLGRHDDAKPLAPRRRRRTYEELVEEA